MIKFPYIIICFMLIKDIKNNNETLSNFICEDPFISCSGNGQCSSGSNDCECFGHFKTYYTNYEDYLTNKPRCNYKGKKQSTALLLAIFLSCGSVQFYLGHYLLGSLQLCFFAFAFCFNTFYIIKLSLKHLKKLQPNEVRESFNVLVVMSIFFICIAFWYTLDVIMVCLNIYRDENYVSLLPIYK